MTRQTYVFATILLGTTLIATGCTTKKRHERDFTNLQNEIGQLQSEVARLDQSTKDTDAALKTIQERGQTPQASTGASSVLSQLTQGTIYRTPSGFELPAMGIQRALKNAGYYQGTLDGKVGSRTKQAIKNFQRDNGLEADGVCGRQTWVRLQQFA